MHASTSPSEKYSFLHVFLCVAIGYLFEQDHIDENIFYRNQSGFSVQHQVSVLNGSTFARVYARNPALEREFMSALRLRCSF